MKKKKSPRERIRRLVKSWAVPVGCGLLFLCLFNFVFFIGYVPTASMEPVIRENSFIIGTRVYPELQIGDVVVFSQEGILMVKRIAGIPGDEIIIDDEVYVVPHGCYFMLGDNPDQSADSRHWEDPFIRNDQVIARVLILKPHP